MAAVLPCSRELYIDVVTKESQIEEIFLFQVDFSWDKNFRTKEYLYKREELEAADGEETAEGQLPPEPLELFREQWNLLCREEVPTKVYAADAYAALEYVFEPLSKKYPETAPYPEVRASRELLHDCISMGRVISMSDFDEEQYLSAKIRRRIKERYHEHVDEIQAERQEHIFIAQTISDEMPVLLISITDEKFRIKKQIMLKRGMKEETLAMRFGEILKLYPDGDIIADAITPELYRLFRNINQFMGVEYKRGLFSLESMLTALGKKPEVTDIVKTYVSYIKNQEEIRRGMFLPEYLYSVHEFYLPVQISSEKAWKQQFDKNSVWKQAGRETYCINFEGSFKGEYFIRAGKEQFALELRSISIQRYLKKYAVIRLKAENYCYPGEEDKKRINELASCLFSGTAGGPDSLDIRLKDAGQAYSLSTVPMEGNENQLWLNGLLVLGQKKKQSGKKALVLSSMREKMHCVETKDIAEEEWIIQTVLIKDGVLRKIEDAFAKTMKPEKSDRPAGSLLRRQKKAIRELYEMYRYIIVSFGENYEASQKKECKSLYNLTAEQVGTAEVITRLKEKFSLFF